MYLNASFQRNEESPVSHEGEYSTDVLKGKALGLLDEAVAAKGPFFLGIAPNAPHSNVDAHIFPHDPNEIPTNDSFRLSAPIPAKRHAHLFSDVVVPRTANFNPDKPSGANWVKKQPKQSDENVKSNDDFYRNRLRALQAVDELVDAVFKKLEENSLLDNTYVFYSTDNGFHIGQHRLQPGKECGFEEDINIPLIVRGPGVPKGLTTEIVTTHTDLAPTILTLAKTPLRADFDGVAIPLSDKDILLARNKRHEHVNVEYWGFAASEGKFGFNGGSDFLVQNNTYKALRVIGADYNLYYSVWCTNEHELYDLNVSLISFPSLSCSLLTTNHRPTPANSPTSSI
jgi:arylsulfatase A-like enzyme